MTPVHVALVAYKYDLDKDPDVNRSSITRVAAALQKQLTNDFTPRWGIPAAVSAFLSFDDIPPGYMPLVIVKPNSLNSREHAFHRTVDGQPIGFVEGGPGWSLPASHELLEMVCDPYGTQKVIGESIADQAPDADLHKVARTYPRPQGPVAYLVEICDPCQAAHYVIDGFQVSDFVTPQYYSPAPGERGPYSFTKEVTQPREVLPGGYLTWFTSIPGAQVWQAIRELRGKLTIGPLAGPAAADSRNDVDYASEFVGRLASTTRGRASAAREERRAAAEARRYGQQLQRDIQVVLDQNYAPMVDAAKFLAVLRDLALDKTYYEKIARNPNQLYKDLSHVFQQQFQYVGGTKFPEQKTFQVAYENLKKRSDRNDKLKIPRSAAITAMQGTTLWAP